MLFNFFLWIVAPFIVQTLAGVVVKLFSYWLDKKDDD